MVFMFSFFFFCVISKYVVVVVVVEVVVIEVLVAISVYNNSNNDFFFCTSISADNTDCDIVIVVDAIGENDNDSVHAVKADYNYAFPGSPTAVRDAIHSGGSEYINHRAAGAIARVAQR